MTCSTASGAVGCGTPHLCPSRVSQERVPSLLESCESGLAGGALDPFHLSEAMPTKRLRELGLTQGL